jgi:hypothetical protein
VKLADGKTSHDRYSIGHGTAWKVDRVDSGRKPLISVTLQRTAGEYPHHPLAPMLVKAALGADAPIDSGVDDDSNSS